MACVHVRQTRLNEIPIERSAGSGATEERARTKHRRAGGDRPHQVAARSRGPTAHAAGAGAGARVSEETGRNRTGGPTVGGRGVVWPPMRRDQLRRATTGHVMRTMCCGAANTVGAAGAPRMHIGIRVRLPLHHMRMGAEAASPTDEAMRRLSKPTVTDSMTMAMRESARTDVTMGRASLSQGAIGKVAMATAEKVREPIGHRIRTLRCQVYRAGAGKSCAQPWAATAVVASGPVQRISN
jgi:hypothetical protein